MRPHRVDLLLGQAVEVPGAVLAAELLPGVEAELVLGQGLRIPTPFTALGAEDGEVLLSPFVVEFDVLLQGPVVALKKKEKKEEGGGG